MQGPVGSGANKTDGTESADAATPGPHNKTDKAKTAPRADDGTKDDTAPKATDGNEEAGQVPAAQPQQPPAPAPADSPGGLLSPAAVDHYFERQPPPARESDSGSPAAAVKLAQPAVRGRPGDESAEAGVAGPGRQLGMALATVAGLLAVLPDESSRRRRTERRRVRCPI
jgi:hypothetical protein